MGNMESSDMQSYFLVTMPVYVVWKDVEPQNCGSVCPNVVMDLYVAQVQKALKQHFQLESSLFLSHRVKRLTVYTPRGRAGSPTLTLIASAVADVPNPHEIPQPTIV
jgi:hypothetical protein